MPFLTQGSSSWLQFRPLVPFLSKRLSVSQVLSDLGSWPGKGVSLEACLPRPFISLCLNQPSLSLFSHSHFPVTLLSNNFHVQFHFFSSSETSKLSARG